MMTDRPVFLVSPPRSGHHMLVRFLHTVLNPLDYCEFYACRSAKGPLPCPAEKRPLSEKVVCRSGRTVQKNHDLDFSLPVNAGWRYVVTLRQPVYSLTSWYTHWLKTAPAGTVFQSPRRFVFEKADYWRAFAGKWFVPGPRPNVLLTRYEMLTTSVEEIYRVAAFIGGVLPEGSDLRLTESAFREKIRSRDIADDARFDPRLFGEVQEYIGPDLIAACGLPLLDFKPSFVGGLRVRITRGARDVRQRIRRA
jgi:hypothetical protein